MTMIRLHSAVAPVTTLGPGPAAVLWTQGCPHACPGCMTPGSWSATGGVLARVDDVAAWLDSTGLDRLTISGGEPMEQALSLAGLIQRLRSTRPWIVTAYSGYLLDDLAADHPSGSATLLRHLDIVIDGPYVASEHAALRWRGSRNQRIHVLSDRVAVDADDPAGVALHVDDDGGFEFIGVPPEPEFIPHLMAALSDAGTSVQIDRRRTFPFPVRRVG